MMKFADKIAMKTGIAEEKIPGSYQIVGHVMLLKFLKIKSDREKKKIANAILEMYPYVKTICEISGIGGELRKPHVKKIAGNGTETSHKEHGILYKMDAAKIMFSKGNLFERQRVIGSVKKNEIVADMFAGIGYFSLGVARNAKKVYAIEKNPIAFKYLKENIRLNKIKNIEPIYGDCRSISIDEKADRILMGYFPYCERYLPAALKLIKRNGVIHFHNSYRKDELWAKVENDLKKYIYGFKILNRKKVKSIAPNTYHVVLDVMISGQNRRSPKKD